MSVRFVRPVAVPVLLAAMVLAGCASPPPSTGFKAEGSQPVVFLGYDYAGATAQVGNGTFAVATDATTDNGTVTASFTLGSQTWQVDFARFAESRPFHEGGVRANFPEHGASGNGDALLPQFTALSAGWGVGSVTVAGAKIQDPLTGADTFALHYMVTQGHVRDPATHKVTKADGITPYDPQTPTDAKVAPGGAQFMVNIQSMGTAAPDVHQDANDTIQAPNYNRSYTFDVNSSAARVAVNISVNPATPVPLAPGAVTFVLVDPAGQPQGRFEYAPTAGVQGGNASLAANAPVVNGTWQLQVSAPLAAVTYGAAIWVDNPDPMFLHVVYSDVRLLPS